MYELILMLDALRLEMRHLALTISLGTAIGTGPVDPGLLARSNDTITELATDAMGQASRALALAKANNDNE